MTSDTQTTTKPPPNHPLEQFRPPKSTKRRSDPAQWMTERGGRAFPPLETVTKPNLTTAELAFYSNMAEQTWRVKACYDTAPEGLRPLRVCGKLAWPTAGAKKLLGVELGA
ncbi:hypothetical protein [Limnohabitans sp.]